jgi:hypothetical protein
MPRFDAARLRSPTVRVDAGNVDGSEPATAEVTTCRDPATRPIALRFGSDRPDVTSLPAEGAEPIVERGEHILNSGQPMARVRMVKNLG